MPRRSRRRSATSASNSATASVSTSSRRPRAGSSSTPATPGSAPVRTLATEPVEDGTDLAKVIEQSLASVTNRSLFILVSDLLVPTEEVGLAVAQLRHRRHDLMLMQVLDRQELEFDFDDAAPFEGLEGEGRLPVDPRTVREDYLAAMRNHCEEIERISRSHGFDYLGLDSHGSVGPAIAALLARRRMLTKGRSSR